MALLDLDSIRNASLMRHPYNYLIGERAVRPDAAKALSRDFPDIRMAGFHPVSTLSVYGLFRQLIEELEGEPLTQALSEKFNYDFARYPRLITIRRLSAVHEGRIHTDGRSKVMSLLLYLNDVWQHQAGRLRVLYNAHDIDHYAAEISPETGTVFAFMRADHSWHGHTSFVGERKVVQVAWVESQEDIARKTRRHHLSSWFKRWLR